MPVDQPLFLMCSERSGSNLIRAMLDAHSQVFAPPPFHLGSRFWPRLYQYGDLHSDANWNTLLADVVAHLAQTPGGAFAQLDADALRSGVAERRFAALYRHVYATGMLQAQRPRLFIKENHSHRLVGQILESFPDARFVFQVRDPRDFVASCKKVSGWTPHYGSIPNALRVWRDDQTQSLNVVANLPDDRYFFLRYEDLIRDAENILGALCRFADLPFDPQMLDFHATPEARKAAGQLPNYWQNLAKPLMSDNSGRYRATLSPTEIRLIEDRVGDLMTCFGYDGDVQVDSPLARIRVEAFASFAATRLRVIRFLRRRRASLAGANPRRNPARRPRFKPRARYRDEAPAG
jgi:hypothetical protein